MGKRPEYRFRIDVFTVESLPMSRLSDYMSELAALLGENERVHFARLEEGSAVLVSNVEEPALSKVQRRLENVRDGVGSKAAMKAFKALDNLLAKDNAVGTLIGTDGAEIIPFPGRERPKPIRYGPFREHGSMDGVLIKIGGKDDTIPVWLQDGETIHYCQTSVELSKQLVPYYRNGIIRVYGSGKWVREEDGTWVLQQFDIENFKVLDGSPLTEVVSTLRQIEGSDWGSGDDAVSRLLDMRRDEGDLH